MHAWRCNHVTYGVVLLKQFESLHTAWWRKNFLAATPQGYFFSQGKHPAGELLSFIANSYTSGKS